MTSPSLSATLKAWRVSLALSQRDMAALLGIPMQTWRKWELGTREPPAVATAYIATLRWLQLKHTDIFDSFKQARKGK